jgi:DegV family protein with EDD domain
MKNVLIITDTVAGIPRELAQKYDIKIIPAAIILFRGDSFIEGETLSITEAYNLIKKDPDSFSTSALTPGFLKEMYTEALTKSNNIIHLTLSGEMSAGYKVASLAAASIMEEVKDTRISVIDTKAVASIQGLLVLEIARAAANGKSMDQLLDMIPIVRKQTDGVMMLDTLRYVYRTGRMSKMGSRIASLFNIKPINHITEEGRLELWDKVRDREKGYQKMIDYINEKSDIKSLHFMVMHAAAPEMADRFIELLKENFTCLSVTISEYSAVMGYGAGPGCIFVGFHPEINLS